MKKSHLLIVLSIVFVGLSAFVVWFSIMEANKPQEIRGQAYGTGGGASPGTGVQPSGGGDPGDKPGSGDSCSESPVNTQFRMYTGKDDPWIDGKDLHPKVGDYIEVNCFAKNGSALLSNPVMTATLTTSAGNFAFAAEKKIQLPDKNKALQDAPHIPELRQYKVLESGKYTFTCANESKSCINSDSFVAEGGASPTPSASACIPLPACLTANPPCELDPRPGVNYCPVSSPTPTICASPTARNKADINEDGKVDINDYASFVIYYRQAAGL